tara:strand:+ start:165 stop:656 length:492 start_codon:yes stop_codon:yes gene_type:complete
MGHLNSLINKISSLEELTSQIKIWKSNNEKIVFTNGCFDILHRGHIELLAKMADLGNRLIIGLNTDKSIKQIKGEKKPIMDEKSRALLLASLTFVDAIILFSQETPIDLITAIKPDFLAKGGDYNINKIVGQKIVQKNGGHVIIIPLTEGFSSSKIINKIKND